MTRPKILYHIDSIEFNDSGTNISGWAFSENGNVDIDVKEHDTFQLKKKIRMDVLIAYPQSVKSDDVGFDILIPRKKISCVRLVFNDGIDITVAEVKKENETYKKIKTFLLKTKEMVGYACRKRSYSKMYSIYREHGLSGLIWQCKRKLGGGREGEVHYQYKLPSKKILEKQKNTCFVNEPTISVIIPVYDTPLLFLNAMLNSILNQTYSQWEACIVDCSPTDRQWNVLTEYNKKDQRLKIKRLSKNMGISGNSNEAFGMATGQYVTFLDHDDLLTPDAFFEVVEEINNDSEIDFIYSDEDKTDETGTKFLTPFFKPDYSPDMMQSINYICHLTVISDELLQKAGRYFNKEYDGSQDYDLFLRCMEKARKVAHIPKVLYHWRMHQKSTASNTESKPYAYWAGKKAIEAHLQRIGMKGRVVARENFGFYKVEYELEEKPLISIVILNCDHIDDLKMCLDSIFEKTSYANYEIIIVENNSVTNEIFAYYEEIKDEKNIHILYWQGQFNYAMLNNWAAKQAHGEYLVFLNNDIQIISPDWLEQLLMFAQRADVGAVGAKLYYPDNTIQHGGVILGIGGVAGHSHKYSSRYDYGYCNRLVMVQNLSAVTAAMMMVKHSVFDEVGGFDEQFAVAFNDVDFCLKIRERGYLIVFNPDVEAYHYESKSRGAEDTPEKKKRFHNEVVRFWKKWGHPLIDPYYNENLTIEREDFSLR